MSRRTFLLFRTYLSCHKELSASVEREDTVEFFFCHILQVAEANNAGVADSDINATKMCHSIVEQLRGLRYLADVGFQSDSVRAQVFDLLDDLLGVLSGVCVVDNDLGTQTTQLHCDRFSNSSPRAGYHRNLAIETARDVGSFRFV